MVKVKIIEKSNRFGLTNEINKFTSNNKIEVIDINGKKASKIQQVVGATEPTIKITAAYLSNGNVGFVVDVSDEDQIATVELTLNDGTPQTIEINDKTYHGEVEMISGENRLKVVVKNRSGVEKVQGARFVN